MAQWSRVLAALAEKPGLVPRTDRAAQNSSCKTPDPLLLSLGTACVWYTYRHTGKKKKKKKKKRENFTHIKQKNNLLQTPQLPG